MAGPIFADFVRETTTTTGTGTYSLAGASAGYQGFVAGAGNGNTCYYAVSNGTDWEVGLGTVTDGSPDTLSRDTILQSSNADAAVNWGAGTKTVDLVFPGPRFSALLKNVIGLACSDETTALTTGTAKATFRMPYAFTVTGVIATVTTAPTGAVLQVDINESGTSILSTKLTIDATEKTSATAATPAVISDTAIAADAEITIDIDQVGSTIAGAGLKVYLIGYPT